MTTSPLVGRHRDAAGTQGRRRGGPSIAAAAHGLPVASSLAARIAQLAVLACVAHVHRSGAAIAVSGIGFVSAFAVITDSGFSNYMLSQYAGPVPHRAFRRGVGYHAVLALAGATAAVGATLFVGRHGMPQWALVAVASMAVAQAADSIARTARAPYLSLGRPARFARPELLSTAAKIPAIVCLVLTASPYALLAIPLTSVLILLIAVAVSLKDVTDPSDPSRPALRDLVPYGAANAVSALYSQAPVIVAGFFLVPADLARLTFVYRTIQPTELLPSTVAQQIMPRLRTAGMGRLARVTAAFAGGGALVWGCVLVCTPVANAVYGAHPSLLWPLLLAGAGLPLKYANYALVSGLVAWGQIRRRLRSSLVSGVVAVGLVGTAAAVGGVSEVLLGVVAAETLLFLLLATAARSCPRTEADR